MASQRFTNPSYEAAKERVFFALNEPVRASVVGRVFSVLLTLLIVLNAIFIIISFNSRISATTRDFIYIFDAVCTVVFLIEYIARIWTADLYYSHLSPVRSRLRYIFSLMGIIDFLAIGPSILLVLGFAPNQTVNALRVLRVIRLIKLSRYIKGLSMISHVFLSRKQEIVPSLAVLLVLILTASVLMYQFENPVQPDKFDGIFSGVYWAVTTITSTGYGDLHPITVEGRIVGIFTMLCSIGIVAIPAGIFSAGFVEEARAERIKNEERAAEKRRKKAERLGRKDKGAHLQKADAAHSASVLEADRVFAEQATAYDADHVGDVDHVSAASQAVDVSHAGNTGDTSYVGHEHEQEEFHYCPYCGRRLP